MILALWINGNKKIGIGEYDNGFIITPSVFDGNQHRIIGAKKFKTMAAAKKYATNLIKTAKAAGTPGEYIKVK